MVSLFLRPSREDHTAAFGSEYSRDLGADTPARPRHYYRFAVKPSHSCLQSNAFV